MYGWESVFCDEWISVECSIWFLFVIEWIGWWCKWWEKF